MTTDVEAIQAEINRLQSLLVDAGTDIREGIQVGSTYNLSIGQAKVVQFYEEEGLEKVQSILRPFAAHDGVTLSEQGKTLCSMPIPRFKLLIKDFQSDQQLRSQIEQRKGKR